MINLDRRNQNNFVVAVLILCFLVFGLKCNAEMRPYTYTDENGVEVSPQNVFIDEDGDILERAQFFDVIDAFISDMTSKIVNYPYKNKAIEVWGAILSFFRADSQVTGVEEV